MTAQVTGGPERARKAGSITRRLVLSLTLGTVVMWCLGVGYASWASYRSVNAAFDQVLRQTALRILPLAADDAQGRESDDIRDIARLMDSGKVHIGYELTDATGKVVLRERDSPDLPFLTHQPPGFSTSGGYRVYRQTDPETRLTITVVESMRDRKDALWASVRAMMWPLLPLVALNFLVIALAVQGAMRPIERLRAAIAARDSRNLAPLDQAGQPRELQPIAEAVARLMERLAHALDAERAFSANSAHELRTPIAGALAQTQRLIAEAPTPGVAARATEIEAALKRLARLSEKLLQLARADGGLGATETAAELKPVLDMVVADCAAHWPGARLVYDGRAVPALRARLDPDAFAIMLRNLIENALTHGAPDGRVEIAVAGRSLSVTNDGPALAPEVLAGLTGRFTRASTAEGGAGLGLAIVTALADQSGCILQLSSPVPGRSDGFRATLTLAEDA